MKRNEIKLDAPKRFAAPYTVSRAKLESAASEAFDMLRKLGRENGGLFPQRSAGFKYIFGEENTGWLTGLYTGCFWLAYQMCGDRWFREKAEELTKKFRQRLDDNVDMDSHDVGFAYSPTCVAEYVVTGDEKARKTALEAAKYFYETSYSKEGKFIIRSWKSWHGSGCRTMMDSLMNAPLLFWAGKETGNEDYFNAARDHVKTTEEFLIRADGSSYHHYMFDPETAKPVRGLTLQGNSDESCWSRGHSWGVYGFPIAYSYTNEDYLIDVHRDITYFMFNHLPEDNVPAWDYDFTSARAIKDSSAGVIASCGLFEMAGMLPDTSSDKTIYTTAANKILEATIDSCTGDNGIPDRDGLLFHVTGYASAKVPERRHIDEIGLYGDFFYLEALARALNPNFKKYW